MLVPRGFCALSIEADGYVVHQDSPARGAWPCSQKATQVLRYHQPLYTPGNAALGEGLADIRQATDPSGHMGEDPALRVHFSKGG